MWQFTSVFAPDKIPLSEELEDMWQLIKYNNGTKNYAKLIRYLKERRVHEYDWLDALGKSNIPLKLIRGCKIRFPSRRSLTLCLSIVPMPLWSKLRSQVIIRKSS
jgi:hypothetical protein